MAGPTSRRIRGRYGGGSTYGATYLGAWSSSQPYAVGDVVDHSGVLYQCTAVHTNQVPPNASYWRVAIVGGGGSYTDENAQDAVGTILADDTTLDFTYDDAAPSITAVVKGVRETSGPTKLAMGAVADGQFLQRVGNTIVGVALAITLVVSSDVGIPTGDNSADAVRST